MKFKKLPLALSEGADIGGPFRFHAHPVQGRPVRDRRDDEITGVLEADKSAVEQMVDAGR